MTYNLDLFPSRPTSDGEWLMQFGDAPDLQDNEHIYAVIEAIEKLSPQSKFCIEAIFYERVPFSKLGERLGVSKPHAWRLSNKALEELRLLLATNKTLNERYNMFSNWNEAATAVVANFNSVAEKRKVEINELNKFVISMQEYARDLVYEEATFMDMDDMGRLATSHLKSVGAWDSQKMIDLLVKKQHDYGHENILGFGLLGLCIRVSDKIARLISLDKRGSKPHNESVIDTWTDIVGYATIAKMLETKTFTLDLEENNG